MTRGIWYAIAAYVGWGLFPIYWKALSHVPAMQLLGHRVMWSCVLLVAVIFAQGQGLAFRRAILKRSVIAPYLATGLIIGVNWLTYVWAVNAGFIVETSLGYFVNPLLSVVLGVVFFRERLRSGQWAAIGLAAAGVIYLTFEYGRLPWIALTLAVTFATYGLIKKKGTLGSVHGLTAETGVLLIPAVAFLVMTEYTGSGAFLHGSWDTDAMLIGAGVVTTIPLLFFASAASRIPLSLVGLLQYIAPTIQFLLGILVYREPFTGHQFIGFAMVWAALVVFGAESIRHRRAVAFPPTPD